MLLADKLAHGDSVGWHTIPQPPGDAPGYWLVVVVWVEDLSLVPV
jgi:hypothetical protein